MKAMNRVLIVFLLLVSLYVTSSHQNTDQNSSEFNITKRVETNDHDAKVFYKHTWPVRVLSLEIYIQ